jgi:hypothetical protein
MDTDTYRDITSIGIDMDWQVRSKEARQTDRQM